jgi:hypothetical protein
LPNEPADIMADDSSTYVVAAATIPKPEDPESYNPVENGSIVKWSIEQGNGKLSETETETKNGLAAVRLSTSASSGAKYIVKGTLKSVKISGNLVPFNLKDKSAELTVVPGLPSKIEFSKNKSQYRSDETDTVEIEATFKDAAGNLVSDDTSISWVLVDSTTKFKNTEVLTINGKAKATLQAPIFPDQQLIDVNAVSTLQPATMPVARVTGTLSSSRSSLDMSVGQTATITAAVNAADETPVYWTTSNGSIAGSGKVSSGKATATLSSANGRLGTVLVSAAVGDRFLSWSGIFSSSTGLAAGAEKFVLVAEASSDGIETITWPNGTVRNVPYFASSKVNIKGPANSIATVSTPGEILIDAFSFDNIENGKVFGIINSHVINVQSGSLDLTNKHSGEASLLCNGQTSAYIPDSAALRFSNEFNISIWVKPSAITAFSLISKGNAWNIRSLSDGKIHGSVLTNTGTFGCSTVKPIIPGVWNFVALQFDGLQLRVTLNSETSVIAAPGTIMDGGSAISLVTGFSGNIDDLALASKIGGFCNIRLDGLDAAGRLRLGADGRAQFIIHSRGLFIGEGNFSKIILHVRVNPEDDEVVVIVQKSWWIYPYDMVASFIGGDPETNWGTAANVAGGFIWVADVGSLAKNAWRGMGWSEKEPNALEATLSGIGLFSIVSGPGDGVVSSVRAIVARIGNTPFAKVLFRHIKAFIGLGKAVPAAVGEFIKKIGKSDNLTVVFNKIITSDDALEYCARAADKLGEPFMKAMENTAINVGRVTARNTAKVLGELSDDVLAALKASPKFDDAVEGLVKVLKRGIDPELMKKVIQNENLYSAGYKHADLLADMTHVANVPGFDKLAKSLGTATNTGFRYELECAAHFAKKGGKVEFLSKFADIPGTKFATDIDVLVDGVAYQCKNGYAALVAGGNSGLTKAEQWVGAVLKEVGGDPNKVKYLVPPGTKVPELLQEFFDTVGVKVLFEVPLR